MIALADCAVVVSDASAAARWWNEKLGFAVRTVGPGGHAVMVAPAGDRFVLHLCEGSGPVEPGNSGIAFVTDDLDQLVLKMRAGGVEFPQPIERGERGAMAQFADPDGNVFWLLEASPAFIRTETRRRAPGPSPVAGRRPARRPARRRTTSL
jgi:predicted enzyme related to lactoylglutathione lyase